MPVLATLVLGLVALIIGAELVVRAGSRLAAHLGIPPLIVGLVIVSVGTSAPELAVGIDAIHQGAGSLAVGNIAGTNIVNILLLLGLTATMRPLPLSRQTIRLDLPAIVTASLILLGLSLDGALSTLDGALLLLVAALYTTVLFRLTLRQRRNAHGDAAAAREVEAITGSNPIVERASGGRSLAVQVVLLVLGLVVIVLGADWLVDSAVDLARTMGVSDAFIGLTVVAIGTSAPELATMLVSTIRGERDIAIGNLIGSSTYNLTLVLGLSLVITPGTVPLEPTLVRFDIPVMVAVALVCIPVFLTGRRISRWEGIACMAAYGVFLGYAIVTGT